MKAAEKLWRLNRLYAVCSGINAAIVRIPDEQRLYEQACRIAVEQGGLLMAWVGLREPSGILRAVARWGKDEGYLDAVLVSASDQQPEGRGPAGEAFRSGRAAVCNDIAGDGATFASRDQALARGYRSCAAFPIKLEGQPGGVFLVYAGEPQFFDAEELELLTGLADNFSFAIDARHKEKQLQESQRETRQLASRLATTLESITDALVTVDREWLFTYVNREAERVLQRTRDQLLGANMWTEFPEGRGTVFEREYDRALREGRTVSFEEFYPPLDAWLEIHAFPSPQGGLTIYFRDISERRAAQQEILRLNAELEQRVQLRTAQLEGANGELEAFSFSVAHDLRAPLAAISGFGHALQAELAGNTTERAKHYLERIREGALRTSGMIDALLSLAQLSRAQLRWEAVDLTAMAHVVIEACSQDAPQRAGTFHVQEGMAAQGDPRLLRLVLENLIGNAVKFSGQQARPEIAVGSDLSPAGETVYFVRDNGVGFDMAYVQKLFGAFQRLHTQEEFTGTGIGLANVRRIVARHSGRVWAESPAGKGATFCFTLGEEPA